MCIVLRFTLHGYHISPHETGTKKPNKRRANARTGKTQGILEPLRYSNTRPAPEEKPNNGGPYENISTYRCASAFVLKAQPIAAAGRSTGHEAIP